MCANVLWVAVCVKGWAIKSCLIDALILRCFLNPLNPVEQSSVSYAPREATSQNNGDTQRGIYPRGKGSPALAKGNKVGREGARPSPINHTMNGGHRCFCVGRRICHNMRVGGWAPQTVLGYNHWSLSWWIGLTSCLCDTYNMICDLYNIYVKSKSNNCKLHICTGSWWFQWNVV